MTVRLGDLAEFSSGGTPARKNPDYYAGDIPWITGADIDVGGQVTARSFITPEAVARSAATIAPAGTILLVTRTSVGKVGVLTEDTAFSQDITAVHYDPTRVDRSYLVQYLRSQEPYFMSRARGATIKGVTREAVTDLRVPLPTLDTQRRIAAILDHADELSAKRRQVVARYDALTQSVFQEMFGTGNWPTRRLDALIDADDRVNYGVVQPGNDTPGGVPLIRVSNLVGGIVDRANLKEINPDVESAYARSRLRGTEILVSSVGTIGVVSLTGTDDVGSNIARAITRVPITDERLRVYVAAYLRTPAPQRYFIAELRTVAQPTLNVGQLAATEVPVPPADLQGLFARRVEMIQSSLRLAVRASEAHGELSESLRSRAFRGEL